MKDKEAGSAEKIVEGELLPDLISDFFDRIWQEIQLILTSTILSAVSCKFFLFVAFGGIGKDTIRREVKGQSIPGEDAFVGSLRPHIKKGQDMPDIPKSHRYVNRPELERIFKENMLQGRKKRNKMIIEAVQKYGYTRRQVAGYLQMH